MEKITFTYNRISAWGHAIGIICIMVILILPIVHRPGINIWPFVILETITLIVLVVFCYRVLVPALNGKIIMELNDDNLNFFLSDKIVYWRNVTNISLLRGYLKFEMRGRLDNVLIDMRFIRGSDMEILKTVQNYFEQTVKSS
jgi:hypothetical protein